MTFAEWWARNEGQAFIGEDDRLLSEEAWSTAQRETAKQSASEIEALKAEVRRLTKEKEASLSVRHEITTPCGSVILTWTDEVLAEIRKAGKTIVIECVLSRGGEVEYRSSADDNTATRISDATAKAVGPGVYQLDEEIVGLEDWWSDPVKKLYEDTVKAVGGDEIVLWDGPTHAVWGSGNLTDKTLAFSQGRLLRDWKIWAAKYGEAITQALGDSLTKLQAIPENERGTDPERM